VPCTVTFRRLDPGTIERYLAREQPYDCTGSAKAEGLGIALIAKLESEDPSALIGLPLIALVDLLREQGVDVL
jgi:septum formation protein